jgi:hypothetical protein
MRVDEIIIQHLESIERDVNTFPDSLIFFGVNSNYAKEIYDVIVPKFRAINTSLVEKRIKEINSFMSPNDILIREKYSLLMSEYKSKGRIIDEIFEWQNDALKLAYENAERIDTPLKELLSIWELIDFDIQKFYSQRKYIDSMRKQLNLENLQRCYYDENFRMNYSKSNEEIEYEKAYDFMHERTICKSAYLYNHTDPKDDQYNLSYIFKSLSWFIFCIDIAYDDWKNKYSEIIVDPRKTKMFFFSNNSAQIII